MNLMKFKNYLTEGVYDPAIFKAIFLAGGPGSGKSYVASKVTSGYGLRVVNSDDVFEKMLKDAGLEPSPEDIYSDKGQDIRGKAKNTSSSMMSNYIRNRLGVVIDGTGKDFEKIKKQSEMLKDLGYDTFMIFVNTSLDVAQERNQLRPRQLDPKEVEKMWKGVQNNIGKFQSYFGGSNFIVVDNNDATEDIFHKVWKYVMKETKKEPKNHIAKEWIENELSNKRRS